MADRNNFSFIADPLKMIGVLWPHVKLYREQQEIIYSVEDNDETYVPAGNMLGKDFTAGLVVLTYFLRRRPVYEVKLSDGSVQERGGCRIVTTSATGDHLMVLWGEINRFIQSAKYPLDHKNGGPLLINYQHLRKVYTNGPKKGQMCPLSYVTSLVASPDSIAAMQGHHIANVGDGVPRTLFVADEASSVPDGYYEKARTWANRMLIIGNTWPCSNFFYRGVKAGDLPKPSKTDTPFIVGA